MIWGGSKYSGPSSADSIEVLIARLAPLLFLLAACSDEPPSQGPNSSYSFEEVTDIAQYASQNHGMRVVPLDRDNSNSMVPYFGDNVILLVERPVQGLSEGDLPIYSSTTGEPKILVHQAKRLPSGQFTGFRAEDRSYDHVRITPTNTHSRVVGILYYNRNDQPTR